MRSDSLLTQTVRNKADFRVTISTCSHVAEFSTAFKNAQFLAAMSVEKDKSVYQPSSINGPLCNERIRKQSLLGCYGWES